VARQRHGRVISFVQVRHAAFEHGRWVTIGLGTVDGARDCAAETLDSSALSGGELPAVRVIAESELAPVDLVRAHADLQKQAQ
jgi:hypothetical protein